MRTSGPDVGEAQSPKANARGERFGSYVLLERLGKGGMAEVHRARLERGGDFRKVVALKRVLPELTQELDFRARFIDEARTVAELQHPNVVQVFDFGEIDERPYLVMELVDGIDLWRLVGLASQDGDRLDVAACLYVIAEAARGLGHAHSARRDGAELGIVHRDVSPQNILVSRLGEVKVTDFGIAKLTKASSLRECETTQGAVLGKIRYMAPEQVTAGDVDGRTDIFALGVVLHEMLTRTPLIDALSPAALVEQVKSAQFDPPSFRDASVPRPLDAIVMRALARDPAERYQRAEDFARALSAYLGEISPNYGRQDLAELVERNLARLEARRSRMTDVTARGASKRPSRRTGNTSDADPITERSAVIPVHSAQWEVADEDGAELAPLGEMSISTREMSGLRTREREDERSRANRIVLLGATAAAMLVTAVLARHATRELTIPVATPVVASTAPVQPLASPVVVPTPITEPSPVVPADRTTLATPAARVAAPAAPARARRLLDGKQVVVDDGQPAPPGEEAAVARALEAYRRAQTAAVANRVADAEASFQRALSEYPGFAPAYRGLGLVYARQGQEELAVHSLKTYLRALPRAVDQALIRREIARLEQGDALAHADRGAL